MGKNFYEKVQISEECPMKTNCDFHDFFCLALAAQAPPLPPPHTAHPDPQSSNKKTDVYSTETNRNILIKTEENAREITTYLTFN